jgi:preprotein translocase subunit SecE
MANTQQVETVNTTADKGKVYGALVIVVAGLVGYYLLAKQDGLVRWGVVLAALIAAAVVFLTSEQGKQLLAFGKDVVAEVKKVVWPTSREALQMTGIVFAFVVVMALFLFGVDKTLEWVIFDLFLGWRK